MLTNPVSALAREQKLAEAVPAGARNVNGQRIGRSPRPVLLALRLIAGVSLLGLLLARADLSSLAGLSTERIVYGVTVAAVLVAMALVLSAIRWNLVLGGDRSKLLFLCRIYFIGWFFSLFLPTSIGGDAVRIVAASKETHGIGAASVSVVLERLLGIGALFAYFAIGSVLAEPGVDLFGGRISWNLSWSQLVLALAVGCVAIGGLYAFSLRVPRVGRVFRDGIVLWNSFRAAPGRVFLATLMSFMVQGTYILCWYGLALAMNVQLSLMMCLVFVPFVSIAAMLPVSVSGLGVREGVWVLLLHPLGVGSATAIVFSIMYYVSGLVVGALGGAMFLVWGTSRKQVALPA